MCRFRQELSNAYLLAKFVFDTAENEPCEVCQIERCSRLVRPADELRKDDPDHPGEPEGGEDERVSL